MINGKTINLQSAYCEAVKVWRLWPSAHSISTEHFCYQITKNKLYRLLKALPIKWTKNSKLTPIKIPQNIEKQTELTIAKDGNVTGAGLQTCRRSSQWVQRNMSDDD